MSEIKLPERVEKIILDHHLLHGGAGFKSINCCSCNSERRAVAVALLRARGLTWEAAGDLRLAGMANAEAEALEREGA